MALVAIFPVVALYLFNWIGTSIAATSQRAETSNIPSFNWSSIEPLPDLEWYDCYSPSSTQHLAQQILTPPSISRSRSFSCARLSLPLDYNSTSNPYNVSVPILKVSSSTSPSHRGTIVTGFGGAGNSRIRDFITLSFGSNFLNVIDPDFEYDFLTFDNRGFGYSSPSAKCFDSVLDGMLWEERMTDLGGYMSTREGDKELEVRITAASAKGELCIKQGGEDGGIRRHMTTAYAARDMLEILKRLPDQASQSFDTAYGQFKEDKIPKLKFIGLSYGTMVGQTFASLYPQYVSRMVLDGAVNAKDWIAKWKMGHLTNTEAVWATFYDDCFEAKESCPLRRMLDSDLADIKYRIAEFLENLKRRPVYIISDGNAKLITYRDVKLAMYWTTMASGFAALIMATVLDGLIRGHTNVTLDFSFESTLTANSNVDAGTTLNCGDAEDITNSSIVDFKEYLLALEEQSSVADFFQGERKIRLAGTTSMETGPFTSKGDNGNSKLSTPILFMGNKLDPMTSLHSLREAVKEFPGSVFLEQDARGHCALGNVAPSDCTLGYLRNYLKDGSLPEPGTVCGKDCNLFNISCFEERKHIAAGMFL